MKHYLYGSLLAFCLGAAQANAQLSPETTSIADDAEQTITIIGPPTITHDPFSGRRILDSNGNPVPLDIDKIRVENAAKITPNDPQRGQNYAAPSTQFQHGTLNNDIRTAQNTAHMKKHANCAVWVDAYAMRASDPVCDAVQEKVKTTNNKLLSSPKTDADWAFVRDRYECGEVSQDLIDLTNRNNMPRRLFRGDDLKDLNAKYKATILARRISSISATGVEDRYECVAWEFR